MEEADSIETKRRRLLPCSSSITSDDDSLMETSDNVCEENEIIEKSARVEDSGNKISVPRDDADIKYVVSLIEKRKPCPRTYYNFLDSKAGGNAAIRFDGLRPDAVFLHLYRMIPPALRTFVLGFHGLYSDGLEATFGFVTFRCHEIAKNFLLFFNGKKFNNPDITYQLSWAPFRVYKCVYDIYEEKTISESDTDTDAEGEAKTKLDTEEKTISESDAEAKTKLDTEEKTISESDAEAEAKTKLDTEEKTISESDTEAEAITEFDAEAKTKLDTKSNIGSEDDLNSDAKYGLNTELNANTGLIDYDSETDETDEESEDVQFIRPEKTETAEESQARKAKLKEESKQYKDFYIRLDKEFHESKVSWQWPESRTPEVEECISRHHGYASSILYLWKVDPLVEEEVMERIFKKYGQCSVYLPHGKCFGYVEFVERKSAHQAYTKLYYALRRLHICFLQWGYRPSKYWPSEDSKVDESVDTVKEREKNMYLHCPLLGEKCTYPHDNQKMARNPHFQI